jgi:hypothetical protein
MGASKEEFIEQREYEANVINEQENLEDILRQRIKILTETIDIMKSTQNNLQETINQLTK